MHPELKKLQERLLVHDWYHAMSDDRKQYDSGQRDRAEIATMARNLGYDGQRLLNAHSDAMLNPATGFTWQDRPKPVGKRLQYQSGVWVFSED